MTRDDCTLTTKRKTDKPRKTAAERREAKAARIAKAATPEAKKAAAKARENRLRKIFNTCSEEYEKTLVFQGGGCRITGKTEHLVLDHRHTDGLLRGILSMKVNKGLAFFDDNPEYLRRAADHLETSSFTIACGEPIYGMIGKVTKKITLKEKKAGVKNVNRLYGPHKTPQPQPRTVGPLYKEKTIVHSKAT